MRAFPRLLKRPLQSAGSPVAERLSPRAFARPPRAAGRARVHARESVTGAVRPSRRPTEWNAFHAGMAQIDGTEIARIIPHLNLSEPVVLGDENAAPRRIIVDRVDAHPLWRQAAFAYRQEGDQDLQGIVVVSRRIRRVSAPCRDWHIERLAVLALMVIEDGEGDAALEIREGQPCLRFRRIAVAIGDRSTSPVRAARR